MPHPDPVGIVMVVVVAACAAVAALLDRSVWAASCGSGVVLVMWAVERLAARRGGEGSFGHGMAVGVVGMVVRVALAVGVLVAIGVAASRDAFVDAALAFAASYTVYNIARLWRHPAVPAGR